MVVAVVDCDDVAVVLGVEVAVDVAVVRTMEQSEFDFPTSRCHRTPLFNSSITGAHPLSLPETSKNPPNPH